MDIKERQDYKSIDPIHPIQLKNILCKKEKFIKNKKILQLK